MPQATTMISTPTFSEDYNTEITDIFKAPSSSYASSYDFVSTDKEEEAGQNNLLVSCTEEMAIKKCI
jgi:hypothetical protein